jgi:hypothetical protein
MSDDFESQLRAALRPVAPSDDFTPKIMARIAAKRRLARRAWWIPASLAASLLIAIGAQRHVQESRERENGMEARREVVEALRLTSQKLNLAYEVVKSQSGV